MPNPLDSGPTGDLRFDLALVQLLKETSDTVRIAEPLLQIDIQPTNDQLPLNRPSNIPSELSKPLGQMSVQERETRKRLITGAVLGALGSMPVYFIWLKTRGNAK
jgi:hypothetical protein